MGGGTGDIGHNGSEWQDPNGNRNVTYVYKDGNEWNSNFNWSSNDWNDNYRWAVVSIWLSFPATSAGFYL